MVARRTLLLGAGAAAAAVPLGVTALASAADRAVPNTATPTPATSVPAMLRNRRAGLRRGVQTPTAEFPVRHLGVVHDGSAAGVRVRTAKGWGPWTTVAGCPGGGDGTARRAAGLVVADATTGYELDVRGGSAIVLEMNAFDGPPVAGGAAPQPLPVAGAPTSTDFRYLPRKAWGGENVEEQRFTTDEAGNRVDRWGKPLTGHPTQLLTVHHQGATPDITDYQRVVGYMYEMDLERYGDLGYHLIIDPNGIVYEGRFSGDDGWPCFVLPPGEDHGGPLVARAAHVTDANAGNLGVCLLDDFTAKKPTDAAVQALVAVLARQAWISSLDPLGRTEYINPEKTSVTRNVDTICGHRDVAPMVDSTISTVCPGEMFYPDLPDIRRATAEVLALY